MLNNSSKPSPEQVKLIESLKNRLTTDYRFQINQLSHDKAAEYRIGLGSIGDNMKVVNQYICCCGGRTTAVEHKTTPFSNGNLFDSYLLNCSSCGENEKISFKMVVDSMKGTETVPKTTTKDHLAVYS